MHANNSTMSNFERNIEVKSAPSLGKLNFWITPPRQATPLILNWFCIC